MRKEAESLLTVVLGAVLAVGCQRTPSAVGGSQEGVPSSVQAAGTNVSIIEPKDRATVPERPYVEGKVSDPNAQVWVVVHPTEVSDYWVQPPLTVRKDGSWRV